MTKKPLITVRRVSKEFKDIPKIRVLSGLTFEVYQNEFLVLVGPSGSGKSTLLRILAGLDTGYSGAVAYGETLTYSDTSFVFQHFALLPWLTIFENVELSVLRSVPDATSRARIVGQELRKFGLRQFANSYPRELSGGMQQRAGLARALVNKPKILFMDEPFSELDTFTASELRHDLLDVWNQESDLTVVMVTHLVEEALELADRIAVLTPRPGKLEKILTNPLPRPRNLRSRDSFQLYDRLTDLIRP